MCTKFFFCELCRCLADTCTFTEHDLSPHAQSLEKSSICHKDLVSLKFICFKSTHPWSIKQKVIPHNLQLNFVYLWHKIDVRLIELINFKAVTFILSVQLKREVTKQFIGRISRSLGFVFSGILYVNLKCIWWE